jgi:hypothetical protein
VQQAAHQPAHEDTVGYEFDSNVLHRRGAADVGIGCPRALLFDVRGVAGTASLFTSREADTVDGEDVSGLSWPSVSHTKFHRRSVMEVGSAVATAQSGLSNFAGGLQAFLGNVDERDELEDGARWFLEDCDYLDVRVLMLG